MGSEVMTPILAAETILKCMAWIEEKHEFNYNVIGELNRQQSDLLHDIEFGPPLKGTRGHSLATRLKDVRVKRRAAKDENEILAALQQFASNPTASNFTLGLTVALGKTRARMKQLDERIYTPRSATYRIGEEESDGEPQSNDA